MEDAKESKKRKQREEKDEQPVAKKPKGEEDAENAKPGATLKKKHKPVAIEKIEEDVEVPASKWVLRIQPVTSLCDLVSSIGAMDIREARFHISSDGLEINALDRAQISTFTAVLPAASFTECTCEAKDGYNVDVNLVALGKLCKSILKYNTGGRVTMYQEADERREGMHLILQMKDRVDRFYLLPLDLGIEFESYRVDVGKADCVVKMPGDVFKRHVDDLIKLEAGEVDIRVDAKDGMFSSMPTGSGIVGSYERQIPLISLTELTIRQAMDKPVRLAPKYLAMFTRIGVDQNIIELHINRDKPFHLVCPLDNKGAHKRYCLAPKFIAEDESVVPQR